MTSELAPSRRPPGGRSRRRAAWTLAALAAGAVLVAWALRSGDAPRGRRAIEPAGAARAAEVERARDPLRPVGERETAAGAAPETAAAPRAPAASGAARPAELAARAGTRRPAVRGRCVETGTDTGIEGVRVTLVVHGEEPAHARTDATGAFEFPSPGNTVSWAEVRRPSRWLAERPRQRLSPEQRYGEEEVRFDLRPIHDFRGRVVDAATGEGVPGVVVHLSEPAGYRATAETDARGAFASKGELPRATVQVNVADAGRFLRIDGGGESWDPALVPRVELAVSIGPTYRLRLDADEPFRRSDVLLHLVARPPIGGFETGGARLRGGPEPWARFPAPFEVPEGAEPWLVARVASSSLAGAAPVASVAGAQEGVVTIRLRPAARLSGTVTDAEGAPLAGVGVRVEPLAGTAGETALARTDGRGGFDVRDLLPGAHRVTVSAGFSAPVERELVLERGPRSLEAVSLGETFAGSIAAVVQLDAPGHPRCRIEVRNASDPSRRLVVEPSYEEDDAAAVFRIDAVPPGLYEVRVLSEDGGAGGWAPDPAMLAPKPLREFGGFGDVTTFFRR